MYDRAPRVLTGTTGSTSGDVGPGKYEPDTKRPIDAPESYAPFLSLNKRQSIFTEHTQLQCAPGPGCYDPRVPSTTFKGVWSNSQSDRFREEVSETPGPGAYVVSKPSDWLRKTYPPKKKQASANEFLSGRVLYTRQPTAPSIPATGQCHGYEEGDDGKLVPQEQPLHDPTMGPAYYNTSHVDARATAKYKGVHFGLLREKRSEFRGRDGPGPGLYDPKPTSDVVTKTGKSRSASQRPASRTESPNLPRYHELVTKQEEKKAVPGPGKYDIRSQFAHRQQQKDASEPPLAPFGSTTKRFVASKAVAPAPGSYSDPRTALESTKRLNGMMKSPFGQTSLRFKEDKTSKFMPGPGSYNDGAATSLAATLEKNALVDYPGTKTAFGSTSVRTESMVKKDALNMPGPSHYVPGSDQPTVSYSCQKASANFASTSRRLYEPPSIVTSIPPPGSYEVADSYKTTQGKVESKRGACGRAGFNSTSTRAHKPGDIVMEEPYGGNPGPGEYDTRSNLTKAGKQGEIYAREPRFRTPRNAVPGPGAYSLSVPLRDTLLKGTFNSSLRNPLSSDFMKKQGSVTTKGKQAFVLGV